MKKVAINASGGGSDIGGSGNGIVEKDMTLKISNKIKEVLESKGIEVLMLRDKDQTIDYDDRIKKLKEFGGPNDVILISNSLNSGGERGIEVIYPLSKSNVLASSIANNLEYFNDAKYYQYRWPTDTSKDYYYITRNTPNYETIIVRYGYVDNSTDAGIIKNDYNAMAEAVAEAVLDYIGANNSSAYVIKSGDTLYSIAQKHNTTVDEIKKLNNLTTNTLTVGNTLKLPAPIETKPATPSTPSGGNTYTVKSGDTLYGIASKYNTTVDEIKKLNNLKSNTLTIGSVLKLPSQSTVTSPSTESNPNTYIVKSGDTLYSIAKQFGLTVDKLKSLNKKTNNLISIGEVLTVGNNKTYVIKSGDTLYGIASKYNTTVDEIKKLNNLKNNTLTIGNTLYIP
ncbi:MAG: LysM peptidoglycan-binding domain-containing protein [Bacilli bacterium]|nr:LysM peptidoglycan-binding domain-containing protein [Bacilli bacterium]